MAVTQPKQAITSLCLSYPYSSRTREDKVMSRLVTITSMRLKVAWYPSNIKFDGMLEEGIFKLRFLVQSWTSVMTWNLMMWNLCRAAQSCP
jgi:hypothetical protein